jgi:hypothetical protein
MGSSNGKQNGEKGNSTRRSTIRKVLRFQVRRTSNPTSRPASYAGINPHFEEHEISTRPLSMFDAVPFHNLEISEIKETSTNDQATSTQSYRTGNKSTSIQFILK